LQALTALADAGEAQAVARASSDLVVQFLSNHQSALAEEACHYFAALARAGYGGALMQAGCSKQMNETQCGQVVDALINLIQHAREDTQLESACTLEAMAQADSVCAAAIREVYSEHLLEAARTNLSNTEFVHVVGRVLRRPGLMSELSIAEPSIQLKEEEQRGEEPISSPLLRSFGLSPLAVRAAAVCRSLSDRRLVLLTVVKQPQLWFLTVATPWGSSCWTRIPKCVALL